MENETRVLFNQYLARQAQLNGVHRDDISKTFNVAPSVQQKLEAASMESDEFMRRINVFPVNKQEGQKIQIGSKGPIASTNNTSDGSVRRNPRDNHGKEPFNYRCRKTNYDTMLSYEQLDAWAFDPAFQSLVSKANARQIALDRMMIGWNGEAYSEASDATKNPLLQDCGIGWLQKIRDEAAHRIMTGATLTSRDEDNKIVARGSYGSLDALVYDVKNSLLEPWHRRAPDLVVIMPSDLMTSINFPRLNALSQTNPNSEAIAGQLIVSTEKVGGLPTFLAPYIPDDVVLITSFKNLSVYYQRGGMRRHIQEEPHYNRVATYQSSNDDFVVEDYGKVAMIDGVKFATAE